MTVLPPSGPAELNGFVGIRVEETSPPSVAAARQVRPLRCSPAKMQFRGEA
jgi:hypothetical protein